MTASKVPSDLHVRLDPDTRAKLAAIMEKQNLTQSQAVRMLIAIALRDTASLDDAVFKQSVREGLIAGHAKLRSHIGAAVSTALSEFEDQ